MEYQWYSTCQYWNGNQTYWTAKALNCWWKHFEKYPSLNLCLCPDNWKSLSFLLNWTAPLFGWFPKDKVLWIYWWWQLNVSPCFGSGFVVMYWLHELSLSHFLTQITVAAAIRLHFNTFPPHIWAHFFEVTFGLIFWVPFCLIFELTFGLIFRLAFLISVGLRFSGSQIWAGLSIMITLKFWALQKMFCKAPPGALYITIYAFTGHTRYF